MFILMCNGKRVDVMNSCEVDYCAKMLVESQCAICTVDQFAQYVGETEPNHHFIATVTPTLN